MHGCLAGSAGQKIKIIKINPNKLSWVGAGTKLFNMWCQNLWQKSDPYFIINPISAE